MGDPNTLADFINWAIATYPAQHYALTLWDHGDGLNGAIFDEDNGFGFMDNLTVMEMRSGPAGRAGRSWTSCDFTACDMGLLEVAYQVRNEASYMVASEDLCWARDGPGRHQSVGPHLRRNSPPTRPCPPCRPGQADGRALTTIAGRSAT